jgi:hypothetical protein
VIFTDPEISSVGLTEAEAAKRGMRVRAVDYELGSVAGASLFADGYQGAARDAFAVPGPDPWLIISRQPEIGRWTSKERRG